MGDRLERIVTATEAHEEALRVSAWLDHLPRPGEVFTLLYRGEPLSVMVVESPCECREAAAPHVHHQIPLPGLVRGAKVVLTGSRRDEWVLEIAPPASTSTS